ncbi:MAG: D-alanine--D-serine ligase VanG [Clostridiales bacterium]|nr:D-alanine--D-serine ligase VanG [Clostridiales bacterium]
MDRPKIAVLFGGCSPEHDVSLKSAYSVVEHIDRERYDPVLLGISRAGEWFHFDGDADKIRDDTWLNPKDCTNAIISPDRKTQGLLVFGRDPAEVRTVRLDAAMPILHGRNGEDGTVQGLLELAGIPVVGCGTLASALCMDKDRAHKIVAIAGIRVPRSFTLTQHPHQSKPNMPEDILAQADALGYPLFVKPIKTGSSFGITMVPDRDGLTAAIKLAFEYDDEIIIEENIPGFEIGCAVLGSHNPTVGEPDEIELNGGFFDYNEKYTFETSAIHVPARISADIAERAKDTAKTIYKALGCNGFARVDMFLTPSGELIFNEVNTIPGFTAYSRYPNMLKAIGMSFESVVNTAIEAAIRGAEAPLRFPS